MLSKFSGEEIIKGFVIDYPKIKDEFKKILYDNGFRWKKDSYVGNEFGMEGLWINYGFRLSIKARWGKTNPNAIIYVEKEFFDKVARFFDLCLPNEGMDSENGDYDLLNKGEIFEKSEQTFEDDKNKSKKKSGDKKSKKKSGDKNIERKSGDKNIERKSGDKNIERKIRDNDESEKVSEMVSETVSETVEQ